MKPTISIITPTYNRLHTLPRLWESLRQQTLANFEWIVMDDGSSDGTGSWVKSLGDKRIVYHWGENRRMGYARNRGMDRMRGTYVIFLDSDDEFYNNESLAIMVGAIQNARSRVGRVIFPPVRDHHRHPANKTIMLGYADYVCRTGVYLSITPSAIAKRFPWQENFAASKVRDYDIARQYNYMFVNKKVWHYHHDFGETDADNASALAGWVAQMPGMIDNVSLLLKKHKAVLLANCPCVYVGHCYGVAVFILLTGTLRQHLRLPRLIGAVVRHGDWRVWVKTGFLLATLGLPQSWRVGVYRIRWRFRNRLKAKTGEGF